MPILSPDMLSPQFEHEMDLWHRAEVFRFYARERQLNCTFIEIQNLWMLAPRCEECTISRWDYRGQLPACMPDNWRDDLAGILGGEDERLWCMAPVCRFMVMRNP